MPEEIVEKTEKTDEKAKAMSQNHHDYYHAHKKKLMVVAGVLLILLVVGLLAIGVIGKRMLGRGNVRQEFRIERQNNFGSGMMNNGRGIRGGSGMMNRENSTSGKVTAVDGKQFTIDASGTSVKVQISDSTRFPLNSATTVTVGDGVSVSGERDSNGVIQAVRIVVNPTTLK